MLFTGIVVLPSEVKVDVLSCAAPNIKASRMIDSKKVQAVISRIKFVLDILEKEACDTVILGAFGCGVLCRGFIISLKNSSVRCLGRFYSWLPKRYST